MFFVSSTTSSGGVGAGIGGIVPAERGKARFPTEFVGLLNPILIAVNHDRRDACRRKMKAGAPRDLHRPDRVLSRNGIGVVRSRPLHDAARAQVAPSRGAVGKRVRTGQGSAGLRHGADRQPLRRLRRKGAALVRHALTARSPSDVIPIFGLSAGARRCMLGHARIRSHHRHCRGDGGSVHGARPLRPCRAASDRRRQTR